MKTLITALFLAGIALSAASAPAAAAGFECAYKKAPGDMKHVPDIKYLEGGLTPAMFHQRLAEMVQKLVADKVPPALIVDHFVWAYCPSAAADKSLNDKQKTEHVRRFAADVAALAYTAPSADELDVLVTLPLTQNLLDQIDSAAKDKKISRDDWMLNALQHAIPTP
ncbi:MULTISPECIES: glutelin [unclassified Brucella]|uniref:glutelin n=1 Tax=Brucella TaxID=234 RepID=UPI000D036FBB|nr:MULTISPECIES: glutelin [unclassified Brucella]